MMNFWLTGFFAWSIVVSIAALSFLLGWHYAIGFCLIVTLSGGILFGRFINPCNHRSKLLCSRGNSSLNKATPRYSQEELLKISQWVDAAADQLQAAAELLKLYIYQQKQDVALLTKLADVFDAAQIIVREVQALMKGNDQACRVGIELYHQLEAAIATIDIVEAIRLQILNQQNKR